MSPNGTPSVTAKQIRSTLLGLKISMTTESTDVESENFTLTENINDIQCFSALPSYDVTLIGQTAIGMAGGVRVKFNTAPDTTIINDFDYEAQMGNQADNRLYDSEGNEIDTPKIVSDVRKIYITGYGGEYEAKLNDETLKISDGETHEYEITQDSTLILINYWD